MQFRDFDTALFLTEYWQKKPLLIRNPWAAWENPLDPDELAGLACEADVESRIVTTKRETWKVEHGPFAEARFGKPGKKPWTLLVQAVDHYVPEVAALIDPFRFVPNWRIDDVMVSYASDKGGVGPHFDQYDVFLVQGLGQRRWQVGARCDSETELLPHDDLRLLAAFEATDEWVLDPGDILYVPPGVAHNGVAIGDDCMTYSVGFRAPVRGELVAHWCDHLLSEMTEDDRYRDPELTAQENPGEISVAALTRLQAMVTERLADPLAFARWFGSYNSAPKNPEIDWTPETVVTSAAFADRAVLCRNPASRFSFVRQTDDLLLLFVDGECIDCRGDLIALAQRICGQGAIIMDAALLQSHAALALLTGLVNRGSMAFEAD
ncbi:cupin domain-containing protein [Sphingomonas sp.]|uniref:cupin domain-containing protein n=1 Tax=Sphingomonas sp. TaxID=28214 RepID=UPI0025DEE30B|nr:cupin domain-containing protein [Sphingomonas sp.]